MTIANTKLSITICHHTGRELIQRCLDSIKLSEGVSYEVIVVTSDVTFETNEALVVHMDGGPAHKRNVGVTYAKSDYFVFLDDDVELSPYCLYELWQALETHPKVGMGFAKIMNMERREVFDDCGSWLTNTGLLFARASDDQRDTGQFDEAVPILASKSATCIIRRDVFFKAGGFDARYFILGEETDLAWRVWLTTEKQVWYFPRPKSWHAFNTKFKPKAKYYTLERIHFHGCKNYINLLLTNLSTSRLFLILPVHLSLWCVSAVGFLLVGQWRRSWLILKGIWWNIINWEKTRAKRRKVQSSRGISDKQLFRHILRNPHPTYYLSRLSRYLTQGLHG